MSIHVRPFAADYWYRHDSSEDQSVRDSPQMGAGHDTEEECLAEIVRLQAQGYRVQRVVLQATCMACAGAGRIGKAPKGTRKAKVASLPYWRLTWTMCTACHGNRYTAQVEVPLSNGKE